MAPFLPIRAISRSQAVRIGGQTIKTNATSYVDLGNLAPVLVTPTLVVTDKTGKASQQHAGSNAKALIKSKFFGYAVTAVDSNGVDTPINGVVAGETEAGAESESNLNFITVNWKAVPGATSYNVYRTGAAQTGLTKALAETEQPLFLANVTEATYQDTGVEVTTQKPPTVNDTNIYRKRAFSPKKELRSHLALGAIVVVGDLTYSNSDWVVVNDPEPGFAITYSAEKVKVAEGTLRQRSTGLTFKVAAKELTSLEAIAGKEIVS